MTDVSSLPLHVLVIDDDEVDRMTVRRALNSPSRTIQLVEAADASEALTALSETQLPFDCIILDYRLPGTDGLSLLRRIRSQDTVVPVIMMTGQHDERLIVEIMKAGATDYLSKSNLTSENLMLSIRNAIRVQRAEQAMRESENRFRTMADSAPVLLWMAGPDSTRIFFNQSWLQFTGRGLAQEIENGWQTAIHPDDLGRCLALYQQSFASRQPFEVEYRLQRSDGEYRWVLESGVPRLTANGIFLGFLGSGVDLTERKRAEQQLRERTEQAVLGAEIGVILTSSDPIQKKLQRYATTIVRHFEALRIHIWTLTGETQILDLQTSTDNHLDENHKQVPVGQGIIGLIAQNRQPYISADIAHDPLIDRAWAAGTPLLAFAGYPLTVQDKVVGVMAVLSSQPLSPSALEAVSSITDELALAIQQAQNALENELLYRQAQEAVELRDVFLSVASHELKTPLTSLMANVQLFIQRATRDHSLNDRDKRTLGIILEQTGRLNHLIGALLDISRLQNGKLTIQREPMDLAELVKRLVHEVQPTLERHTITLDDYPGALPLFGDEIRLEQVIQNLLQNAIKYSPKGGTIIVRVGMEDGMAFVAVTDQGIGIPQNALPHLFDRFFQVPNAYQRNISGMGLGLYIVREIVGLHGGTIDVHTVEGQGSTFTVKLPIQEPPKDDPVEPNAAEISALSDWKLP